MKKQRNDLQVLTMTELAILTAVIIIMAFTPLGYLKTAGLEITFITIPVIVGAIVLGPKAGAFLGCVFGVTSFLQAALGLSAFGIVLMGISPLRCFLVCIPARILMGLFTGIIWNMWKKKTIAAYSITSFLGALLNTLFFMTALIALFWNTDFIQGMADSLGSTGVLAFTVAFVGINGLVEAVCCFTLAGVISKSVNTYVEKIK